MRCPACEGKKALTRNLGGRPVIIPCVVCEGGGVIGREELDRLCRGKQIVERRHRVGIDVRTFEKRLGCGSGELWELENGRPGHDGLLARTEELLDQLEQEKAEGSRCCV